MKTASVFLLILASSAASAFGAAPTWDTSGNSQLNGGYYFREVLYVADAGGNTSRALTLYGTITFSAGTYTISGVGGLDSQTGQPGVTLNGTYSLSASGYGFMSNPLLTGGTGIS